MTEPHHTPANATDFTKDVDDPVTLLIVFARSHRRWRC